MAIQAFGGLIFEGTLTVTLVPPPDRSDVVHRAVANPARPGPFLFGTTSAPGEKVKINGPQVCFEWKVRANGTGNVHDWDAGMLQSISHGSWVAHYSNGEELKYRLNTDYGFVRDGESTNSLFFRKGHSLKPTALTEAYEFQFLDPDVPSVTFVTEFSGNPFHPDESAGGHLGQLSCTEGKVEFSAFLAVVNKTTRSIITLAESHWTLTWDGIYDFSSKTWAPKDPDGIITHNESDLARTFENPRNPAVSLPFSLNAEVANERKQVWTSDGWKACREGLPELSTSASAASKWSS